MFDILNTWLQSIIQFQETNQYIDLIVVLVICLSEIITRRYFNNINLRESTKTLIIGTVFTLIYILVLHWSGTLVKENYVKLFLSYTVATSLNEIIIRWIIEKISKTLNKDPKEIEKDIYK